jgi:hypothetical protein
MQSVVVLGLSTAGMLLPPTANVAYAWPACGVCVPVTEEYHCLQDPDSYFQSACMNSCGETPPGSHITCGSVPDLWCNNWPEREDYFPVLCNDDST